MPRTPNQEPLYLVGRRFADDALINDGSLFAPGTAVWTQASLENLKRRFIDAPDLRTGVDFATKYRGQMAGADRATILLGAEAMFVLLLVPSHIGVPAKRRAVESLLVVVPDPPTLPDDLAAALGSGLPSGGMSFNHWRDRQMCFVIEFALTIKRLAPVERRRVLSDSWALHDLAHATPDHGGWAMRDAMLYLLQPDTFEPMFGHKKLVARAFPDLVTDPSATLDRQLFQIRSRLAVDERLTPDFDFYQPPVFDRWGRRPDTAWDELIGWMLRFAAEPTFDETERSYKAVIAANIRAARDALRRGDEWVPLVRRAFGPPNNLSTWQSYAPFLTALAETPDTLGPVMHDLWDGADEPTERVRRFSNALPASVPPGAGQRCALASYMLMANSVGDNPFLAADLIRLGAKAVGRPIRAAPDAGERYDIGIGLLDTAISEAAARGSDLSDRLDAQCALWCVFGRNSEPPASWPASLVQTWRAYRGEAERGSPWDEFVGWAGRVLAWDGFEAAREPTVAVERALIAVRTALAAGALDWPGLLAAANVDHLTGGSEGEQIATALETSPDTIGLALRALWNHDVPIDDRVEAFAEAAAPIVGTHATTVARIASVLLIADGHEQNPAYFFRSLGTCRKLTGEPPPPAHADPATLRRSAVDFLERLVDECRARDVETRDILDARLVTWFIGEGGAWEASLDEDERERLRIYRSGALVETVGADDTGDGSEPKMLATLDEVARSLYLPDSSWLRELALLAGERSQLILYGPPGTGKTYIARALARLLAGSSDRVRLVQFHPSYAYEDFIEGYRPNPLGTPPFTLRPGPLRRIAALAEAAPDECFVLIIDEINRGNIAKVFGELYFLLEYRDETISLQYADDESGFRLPGNLLLIGTMNTSDRSIAILDAAVRRRFAFVELTPREEPVSGVLERFLEATSPGLEWLPDVLRRANALLHDHDSSAAIGPSHFMKAELTHERVQRIWRYDVLPLIEEIFFDDPSQAKAFTLDRLRASVALSEPTQLGSDDGPDRAETAPDAR